MPERRQAIPILAPDLGLITGTPDLSVPDRGWTAVKNGRFRVGRADKVPGYVLAQAAALDGPVQGLYDYNTTAGFQAWIAVTKAKCWKKEVTDAAFVDITGGTPLTGQDDDWVDFTNFKDVLVFTNGRDVIKKWTGSGNIASLAGSPPKAKRITTFQNHVMLGWVDPFEVTPRPQRIQWSDLGLHETWSGGEAGSLDLVDEPYGILEIMPLRDSMIAYKEDAGYLVDYTGFPFTMQTRRLFTGTGPIAARIVVPVRDAHYFVAHDRMVYKVTLSGPEPVGQAVRFGILDELNHARRGRSFGYLNDAENEINFVIPRSGSDFPDLAYIYEYLEQKWGRRDLGSASNGATAASTLGAKQLSSLTWDEVASSWDAQTITWDSFASAAGANIPLHGDRNGFVYKHTAGEVNANGVAIDWEIDSRMHDLQEPTKKKRLQRIHLTYESAAGTTLSVYVLTTEAPGVAPTVNGPFDIVLDGSGDQWVDINLTAKYFQFRFKNASLGQPATLTGYTPVFYTTEET